MNADTSDAVRRMYAPVRSARLRDPGEPRTTADLEPLTCLSEVATHCARADQSTHQGLGEILDAAVAISMADMGNVQLLERRTNMLCLAVHRGFDTPFVEFFGRVRADQSTACGLALQLGARMIVEDVITSDVFSDPAPRDAMLAAGVRSVQSTPLVSSSGAVLGMISTHARIPGRPSEHTLRYLDLLARLAADFLERRESEQTLRVAQDQLAAIFNDVPVGVCLIDDTLRICQLNPTARQAFGSALSDPVGRDAADVFRLVWPSAYADELVRQLDHTLATGEPYRTTERGERRSGHIADCYEWQIHRIPLGHDRYGVVCYMRDVAAEVQAREMTEHARVTAETANRAKSEFLAAMSHELRTPLNAITGYVQLLEMGIHGPITARQQEVLERIRLSEQHVLARISDVLSFAKLEAGRIEYDVRDLPLAAVVNEAVAMMGAAMAEKGLTCTATLADDVSVRGDFDKLLQILLNLLSNAVKFTPRGGSITLDAPRRPGMPDHLVFLRIADSGIGVPGEQQDAVFEPFVRVRRTFDRPVEGTGLGLAISRELARGMGGELRVRSWEGAGSRFTVAIPAPRRREAPVRELLSGNPELP